MARKNIFQLVEENYDIQTEIRKIDKNDFKYTSVKKIILPPKLDSCYVNFVKDVKGLEEIEEHAKKFVKDRLSSDNILNDGKQTPMRGHPVFIAQHACACCCRAEGRSWCAAAWHGW